MRDNVLASCYNVHSFLNLIKCTFRTYDLKNETILHHLLGRAQSTLFVVKTIGYELVQTLSNQPSNFWSANSWLFVHSSNSQDIIHNIELKFKNFSGIAFNSHLYVFFNRQFVCKHYDILESICYFVRKKIFLIIRTIRFE